MAAAQRDKDRSKCKYSVRTRRASGGHSMPTAAGRIQSLQLETKQRPIDTRRTEPGMFNLFQDSDDNSPIQVVRCKFEFEFKV